MKSVVVILVFFVSTLLFYSFVDDIPYFSISRKDVHLEIPKGFPKPFYDYKKNKVTPEGFVLGRKLFYDPILSKDYFTSCATCHQRFAAFAHIDHPLSHGIIGQFGNRNVPALQNLIWKDEYMADGGINHLDLQPIAPITNPIEMGETMENVIHKLQVDSVYPSLFKSAYGDTMINTERLMKSLSQFLCMMISSNSRFDLYLQGKEKFSEQETNGLQLFRKKCESCHKEPLFTDNSYRNIGLKPDTSLHDKGRAGITGLESDINKFKVPSLRNVEMTYPYAHDGRFKKLKDVMNHYANPEKFSEHADPSLSRIGTLSEVEQKDIIAFLLTLTDKTYLYDRRFADPNVKLYQD